VPAEYRTNVEAGLGQIPWTDGPDRRRPVFSIVMRIRKLAGGLRVLSRLVRRYIG
jgi:hypothetical protein